MSENGTENRLLEIHKLLDAAGQDLDTGAPTIESATKLGIGADKVAESLGLSADETGEAVEVRGGLLVDNLDHALETLDAIGDAVTEAERESLDIDHARACIVEQFVRIAYFDGLVAGLKLGLDKSDKA